MLRQPLLPAIVCIAFGCLMGDASFDPDRDDTALAAITRTWAGPSSALALCEDTAAAAAPADGCTISNVVRGGGRGERHSHKRGGCGGCPEANTAFVAGTLTGGGLNDVALTGRIRVGDVYEDDPYAPPYEVELSCSDPSNPCVIGGTIEASGELHLTIELGQPGVTGNPTFDATLSPTGNASCGTSS